MAFIRRFDEIQIQKLTEGENAELFAKLKADILRGMVFPAVRKDELHFYYKGGCLYKFSGGSFKRDKNYQKFGKEFEALSPYEKAKKENEIKFKTVVGKEKERALLDGLNCHSFDPNYTGKVVVLDIEVNLNGTVGRGKKCDMVLMNKYTNEIMFVEGKVFSDSRMRASAPNIPEVVSQVNTYTSAIIEQEENILNQYEKHIQIINALFASKFGTPRKLIKPAKLIVYETPKISNGNGGYSIDKINSELGENNLFWIGENQKPTPDEIWQNLAGNLKGESEG